ncbi:gll3155 [Gloeobacter violaceus PCC 7421]|uniref:Gll3155 protein n=1 Tax=Gloeobacter violaceus (strain ATCC 29082 / PCC 7421) TaxID=251221 RepID=Q7NGL4_GLOVI|nr:gll3155 [Gloeobacter violaceus PCC 7421]
MATQCANPQCGYDNLCASVNPFCPVCGEPLPSADRLALKLVDRDLGLEFWIARDTLIGRAAEGVDLSGLTHSQVVSRSHAFIRWDANYSTYTVTDVNSRNGTLLNGFALTPGIAYALGDGDRLQLGRDGLVEMAVLVGASAGSPVACNHKAAPPAAEMPSTRTQNAVLPIHRNA